MPLFANCSRNDTYFNVTTYHNKTCVNNIFHPDQEFALGLAILICGLLSFLGSSFIIITFASFRRLQVPALRLVLYLAISDFLSTVTYVTNPLKDFNGDTCELYPICFVQAIFGQFAELARIFWVSCIAFNLWSIAVRGMSERVANKLQVVYHAVSWGVPGLGVIVMLAGQMVGPAGAWCWVSEEFFVARLLLLYVWLIIAIVFVLVLYVQIGFAVRGSNLEAVVTRLNWYMLVFLLCNIFGLANRIQNFAAPCSPVYWLYLLQSISNAIQGFCNALVYGANRIVFEEYRSCLKRLANQIFGRNSRRGAASSDFGTLFPKTVGQGAGKPIVAGIEANASYRATDEDGSVAYDYAYSTDDEESL